MKLTGNYTRTFCPICGEHINESQVEWIIPFVKVDDLMHNGYRVSYLPIMSAKDCVQFMRCMKCDCIYRNPVAQEQGHKGDYYLRKMEDEKQWNSYHLRYKYFREFIPAGAKVFIDAACAIGQFLHVARDDAGFNWQRLIGIEYNADYVKGMAAFIEGHQVDLNAMQSLTECVGCDNADFIVFSEAFEHMRYTLPAMTRLMSLLRSGGRMFFSSQAIECDVPVRPEESIYVCEKSLKLLAERCSAKIVKQELLSGNGRWYTIWEKA